MWRIVIMFPIKEIVDEPNPYVTHRLVHESLHEINEIGQYGFSPLVYAILAQNVNVVELLLEHGADTSITNSSLKTPLFQATCQGSIDIVRLLLMHKANPNEAYTGKSAYQYACRMVNGSGEKSAYHYACRMANCKNSHDVKIIFRVISTMLHEAVEKVGTVESNRTPRPMCPLMGQLQTSHDTDIDGFGVECRECGAPFYSPTDFESHMRDNHHVLTPYEIHVLRSNEFRGPHAHHRLSEDKFRDAMYDTESDSGMDEDEYE